MNRANYLCITILFVVPVAGLGANGIHVGEPKIYDDYALQAAFGEPRRVSPSYKP